MKTVLNTAPSVTTVIDAIGTWDADAKLRDELDRRVAVGFDNVLRRIVEAVESGHAEKSGRTLAAEAKKQGMTLWTNGGKAPSDKWFDRHHAIGVFYVAVDDQITAEDAVELTTGLGHGEGKVTPAMLRSTVSEAVTDGKDVLRAVAALFAARHDGDTDGDDTDGEGDGDTADDTKAPTTDADLVNAVGQILKGWQGDGTATADDLLALIADIAVYA